jgi:hypothetical protein
MTLQSIADLNKKPIIIKTFSYNQKDLASGIESNAIDGQG